MMKKKVTGLVLLALAFISGPAAADDSSKNSMVVEFDPVAVSAAVNEHSVNGFSSNQFGMTVDFPASQSLATGPEFWGATYYAQGPADGTTSLRHEDLFPSESLY